MSKLTKEDVFKLARLARLKLTEDEVDKYQNDLSSILDYINILDDVDVDDLRPTSQVTGLVNVMRDDTVAIQPATPDDLIAMAPERQGRYIKVKRMI